jgi:MFS superfamily sulfate permease-like transporter
MSADNTGMVVSNLILTLIMIAALAVGTGIGYLGFICLGPIANYCQIKYVAEEEIMALERKRVESEIPTLQTMDSSQDLFFGNIDKAVELTERLAQGKNDRKTRVIFSISPVFAGNVESISEQIHKEVINQLSDRALTESIKRAK